MTNVPKNIFSIVDELSFLNPNIAPNRAPIVVTKIADGINQYRGTSLNLPLTESGINSN